MTTMERTKTFKILDRLAETLDPVLARHAKHLRDHLSRRPMDEILDKVPGITIAERARICGVSRETYYSWIKNKHRPNLKQAQRLAAITGYSLAEIRGSTSPAPPLTSASPGLR